MAACVFKLGKSARIFYFLCSQLHCLVNQKSNHSVDYCRVLLQEAAIFHFPHQRKLKQLQTRARINTTQLKYVRPFFIRIYAAVTVFRVVAATASGFCGLYQKVLQQRKQHSHSVIRTGTDLISSVPCGCLTLKWSCIFISSFWIHHNGHWWHSGVARQSVCTYIAHFIRSRLNVPYIKMHTATSSVCLWKYDK